MQELEYNVIYNDEINIVEEVNGNKTVNSDIFDTLVTLITEYYLMNINK